MLTFSIPFFRFYQQSSKKLIQHTSIMAWRRPLQATVQGAAITVGSVVISCGLAIQVEASAHRLLFWCVPEKYANVEQAYGLEQSQLDSVRHLGTNRLATGPQTDKERAEPLSLSIY
jgi:hypothetical protein